MKLSELPGICIYVPLWCQIRFYQLNILWRKNELSLLVEVREGYRVR